MLSGGLLYYSYLQLYAAVGILGGRRAQGIFLRLSHYHGTSGLAQLTRKESVNTNIAYTKSLHCHTETHASPRGARSESSTAAAM
jgi:hypothetical protein